MDMPGKERCEAHRAISQRVIHMGTELMLMTRLVQLPAKMDRGESGPGESRTACAFASLRSACQISAFARWCGNWCQPSERSQQGSGLAISEAGLSVPLLDPATAEALVRVA